MKFSVVIPLYNKEVYIKDTIISVLNQSYRDFEVIVVDDSSTDNSYSIIESFSDKRIKLYKKENGGVSAARNYGISKSQGEVICFLDADDLWDREYLTELNKSINDYPDISFFCGSFKIFENTPDNIVKIKRPSFLKPNTRYDVDFFELSVRMFGSAALTSAVAIRSSFLKSMEYWFDERYCIGEDNDMWVRVCLNTTILYNTKPLMYYRSFSKGGLTHSHYNFSYSVDYSVWYSYYSNQYVHMFATQMIYTLARICYNNKDYDSSFKCLSKTKGFYLFFRRLVLFILSYIRK